MFKIIIFSNRAIDYPILALVIIQLFLYISIVKLHYIFIKNVLKKQYTTYIL